MEKERKGEEERENKRKENKLPHVIIWTIHASGEV